MSGPGRAAGPGGGIDLPESLARAADPDLGEVLRREVAALGPSALPLQQGLRHGSHVLDDGMQVTVLGIDREGAEVVARLGIFYWSVLAGCACADDPGPVNRNAEYCELRVRLQPGRRRAVIDPV